MQGKDESSRNQAAVKIFGTDQYEWVLDGIFILHPVDIWIGDTKVVVLELIGKYNEHDNTYMPRSFDNSGQSASMTTPLKMKRCLLRDRMPARY